MGSSKLKLNPDKTEFILLGSASQRKKLSSCFPVDILGNNLCPADKVRNLGVFFDSSFTMSSHVASICRQCFVSLHDFRRIRSHLSKKTAITVANALVSSKLDYCNSLFRSLKVDDIHKLQCIQNSLARIVSNPPRSNKIFHITPVRKDLHWLPIRYRIIFKTLTLIHKFIHTGLPYYFSPHISFYSSSVNTRRSDPDKLFLHKPPLTKAKSVSHIKKSFFHEGPIYGTTYLMIYASYPPSLVSGTS